MARTLRPAGGDLLESLALFDVYRGPGLVAGARSLAYRLRFCALDRTLTDAEVGELRRRCIERRRRSPRGDPAGLTNTFPVHRVFSVCRRWGDVRWGTGGDTVERRWPPFSRPPHRWSDPQRTAPGRRPGPVIAVIGVVVIVVGLVTGIVVSRSGGAPGPLPGRLGISEDRPVPASVLRIPLVNQNGQTTSLGAFRGKIVVLTSFLTSCQETCPLTTGAFLDMQRDLAAAGMAGKVTFIEASVDPGRDVPSRLAAYARVTGTTWPLLTGTAVEPGRPVALLRDLLPEGEGGEPAGHRLADGEALRLRREPLRRFHRPRPEDGRALRHRGRSQPAGPQAAGQAPATCSTARDSRTSRIRDRDSWTIPEGLQAIGWVAGRTIPASN